MQQWSSTLLFFFPKPTRCASIIWADTRNKSLHRRILLPLRASLKCHGHFLPVSTMWRCPSCHSCSYHFLKSRSLTFPELLCYLTILTMHWLFRLSVSWHLGESKETTGSPAPIQRWTLTYFTDVHFITEADRLGRCNVLGKDNLSQRFGCIIYHRFG